MTVALLSLCLAASPALHFPRIVPSPPEHALDVGPMLVDTADEKALLAEADRLHVDVLVRESRSIADFYSDEAVKQKLAASTLTSIAAGLLSAYTPNASNTTAPVLTTSADSRRRVVGFYRGLRLNVDHARICAGAELPGETLDAQFAAVHAAFANHALSAREYETIRGHLLSLVDRSP